MSVDPTPVGEAAAAAAAAAAEGVDSCPEDATALALIAGLEDSAAAFASLPAEDKGRYDRGAALDAERHANERQAYLRILTGLLKPYFDAVKPVRPRVAYVSPASPLHPLYPLLFSCCSPSN